MAGAGELANGGDLVAVWEVRASGVTVVVVFLRFSWNKWFARSVMRP